MKKSIYSKKSEELQELLVKARLDAGLTQQQLAEKLGKHQSFVAKYENGERRLDLIEFLNIARELKINPLKIVKDLIS